MNDTPDPAPQPPASPDNPEPTPTPETPPTALVGAASDDDKNMGMLAHLLGAFTGFLGPLIIWLIKKDESKFVDQEGKESLNFQITAAIIYIALIPVSVVTCGAGTLLYFPVLIVVIVFSIIAALKAKDGIAYRYPMTLRLIK